jgi:hypothetical protein
MVWRKKFGIEPILLFLGNKKEHQISEEYGKVIEFPVLADIPVYIQTQWARYWYTQTDPETIFIVSDIDMIPLSKFYFVDQIRHYPVDSYLHLNPMNSNGGIPTCYHVAKGRVFKDILSLDTNWEQSIRFLCGLNIGKDVDGNKYWFSEERYCGSKLFAKKGSDPRIVFVPREGGSYGHRIDREL